VVIGFDCGGGDIEKYAIRRVRIEKKVKIAVRLRIVREASQLGESIGVNRYQSICCKQLQCQSSDQAIVTRCSAASLPTALRAVSSTSTSKSRFTKSTKKDKSHDE
jgi:hypothetical protein